MVAFLRCSTLHELKVGRGQETSISLSRRLLTWTLVLDSFNTCQAHASVCRLESDSQKLFEFEILLASISTHGFSRCS